MVESNPSGIPNRKYLTFTVFVAGMSTLAIEFTTSRMLQTVYGTSNLVWANVIGLVLLFLTVGYFIGGWLADRYPIPQRFLQFGQPSGLQQRFLSAVNQRLIAYICFRTGGD